MYNALTNANHFNISYDAIFCPFCSAVIIFDIVVERPFARSNVIKMLVVKMPTAHAHSSSKNFSIRKYIKFIPHLPVIIV